MLMKRFFSQTEEKCIQKRSLIKFDIFLSALINNFTALNTKRKTTAHGARKDHYHDAQ